MSKSKKVSMMNGEHGKLYDRIDFIRSSLETKIDAIKDETSSIKTDVEVIKSSLNNFPCNSNSNKIGEIEKRMYMAVGGLGLLLITKQLGLW